MYRQGIYPNRVDQHRQRRVRTLDNKGHRSKLDPRGIVEESLRHDYMSLWRTRYQYRSCLLGSWVSRRSSRHYGSRHGTWHRTFRHIVRSRGTSEPIRLLCRKRRACNSRRRRRGSLYLWGSLASRLGRHQRSRPGRMSSIGRHPSPCQRGRTRVVRLLCVHRSSSSRSGRCWCDDNLDDSGESVRRSNTAQCVSMVLPSAQ